MTSVKLLVSALVGHRNYLEGDVVSVPDDRARSMIANEVAEPAGDPGEDSGGHANADANPLADVLTPLPHDAIPINPADALSPHVGDHPGLKTLVEKAGKEGEESPTGRTSTIAPVPTKDVASQEAIDQSHREAHPERARPVAPKGVVMGDQARAEGVVEADAAAAAAGVPAKAAKPGPTKVETATLAGAPATATKVEGKAT